MNLYVSPNGNDQWSGRYPTPTQDRSDGPLASLAGAVTRLALLTHGRSYHPFMPSRHRVTETAAGPITVHLRGGRYSIEKPVVFGPEHSWPVTFKPYRNEKPVISGAKRITNWQTGSVNGKACWVADLPDVAAGTWEFRELFVNGRRAERPRLPDQGLYRMKDRATC